MSSAGIVVALTAIGLRNATIDKLAIRPLVARVGQTEKHIAFAPTTPAVRFASFFAPVLSSR